MVAPAQDYDPLSEDEWLHTPERCARGSGCPDCKYRRMAKLWRRKLVIAGTRSSWLVSKVVDGNWGAGCIICHARDPTSIMGRFEIRTPLALQLCHLLRHQRTAMHRLAEAELMEQEEAYDPRATPSNDMFQSLWKDIRDGGGTANKKSGIGMKDKLRKMKWCLAEAIRTLHRAFLRDANTISIFQDGSNGRLLLRFKAAKNTLEERAGVLGLEKNYSGGHEGIVAATNVMLERAATIGVNRPNRFVRFKNKVPKTIGTPQVHDFGSAGVLDANLLHAMRHGTELYCSDAAGDENLAGKTLLAQGHLPRLGCVTRDKCHGLRRVISRPWAADKVLSDVVGGFVFNKNSPTSLIEYSGDLQLWFQRCREELPSAIGRGLLLTHMSFSFVCRILKSRFVLRTADY